MKITRDITWKLIISLIIAKLKKVDKIDFIDNDLSNNAMLDSFNIEKVIYNNGAVDNNVKCFNNYKK
jgi:hypothetical protein